MPDTQPSSADLVGLVHAAESGKSHGLRLTARGLINLVIDELSDGAFDPDLMDVIVTDCRDRRTLDVHAIEVDGGSLAIVVDPQDRTPHADPTTTGSATHAPIESWFRGLKPDQVELLITSLSDHGIDLQRLGEATGEQILNLAGDLETAVLTSMPWLQRPAP